MPLLTMGYGARFSAFLLVGSVRIEARHAAQESPQDVLIKILINEETEHLLVGVGISRWLPSCPSSTNALAQLIGCLLLLWI